FNRFAVSFNNALSPSVSFNIALDLLSVSILSLSYSLGIIYFLEVPKQQIFSIFWACINSIHCLTEVSEYLGLAAPKTIDSWQSQGANLYILLI
ncbi:MAG: hypothetical protein ACRC80_04870, partial [Waterburya sp.]